jgi:hypothetical protein
MVLDTGLRRCDGGSRKARAGEGLLVSDNLIQPSPIMTRDIRLAMRINCQENNLTPKWSKTALTPFSIRRGDMGKERRVDAQAACLADLAVLICAFATARTE